jgi:NADPH:quinone reductase-like Zn-dependent oxidoreductase
MRAALHRSHGGLDVLEVAEVPDPQVGPGDVLIAVRAAGLNRLDLLQRQGPPLLPGFTLPHIAGMDAAGEVVAVGPEVDGVAAGDRVLVDPSLSCGECDVCRRGDDAFCPHKRVFGGSCAGGYAELAAVPATHVHRIPEGVSYEEAATIPTAWSTAWHALMVTGRIRLGETVMIHAAGSGVSTAAIQLAVRAGARVIATAGSRRKLDVAKRLGAEVLVDNRTEDVAAAARAATGGAGVDMVFDHVGPALFQPSVEALRQRGRLVFCGATTGVEVTLRLPRLYHFGLQLLGADSYTHREFAEMLDFYWRGGFEAVIDSVHRLDDVAAAQARLESGESIGKVLLVP